MQDPIAEEKQAWDEWKELCLLRKDHVRNFIRIGQLLKTLNDTGRFKKLGDGGYDTWESFIANPELKMTRGYVFQSMQAFTFYITTMEMSLEDVEKFASVHVLGDCMRYIIKHNLDREPAMELISKAQALSLSDYITTIRELEGPKGEEVIEGEQVQEQGQLPSGDSTVAHSKIHITTCDMCHKQRVEYYEDEICQCDGTFHLTNKTAEDEANDYQHENVPTDEITDSVGERGGE